MKVDDEIVELAEWDAVGSRPVRGGATRPGPEGLEILVLGAPNLGEDPRGDVDGQRDWWADYAERGLLVVLGEAVGGVRRGAAGLKLARGGGQSPVGDAGQQAPGRDAPDAEPGELGERRHRRGREHVDGHADRVDHRRDLLRRREPGRIDAVGAGVAVGDEARDRVVEVVDAVEVVLRAAREHEWRIEGSGRRRGLGDALGREPDVLDLAGDGVPVLDRAARCARLAESADGLGDAAGVVRVAALAVDVERQVGRRSELGDVGHELVPRHLRVQLAEHPREACARRRERLEPERGENARRADVPRVRHHEELLAGVQLAETGAAGLGCHRRPSGRRSFHCLRARE